jgi:hypothetical protein
VCRKDVEKWEDQIIDCDKNVISVVTETIVKYGVMYEV